MSICVQQGAGNAEKPLRAKREEAGLRSAVQGSHRMAQQSGTAWLADAPVHPLQQTLKDLERAYANFFAKRADFPRFKKKGQGNSFPYPDQKQFKIDQANSRIFLPKLGWMRYRNSRNIVGTAKNISVSSNGGNSFLNGSNKT
jgi:transposase